MLAQWDATVRAASRVDSWQKWVGHTPSSIGMTISAYVSPHGLAPEWSAAFVQQSFPGPGHAVTLAPGEELHGYIQLRNTGWHAWHPGHTFLDTTQPRDGGSAMADPSWVDGHRPVTINRIVPPGERGRFTFTIRAPMTPGRYTQHFEPKDGSSWFGHPADDTMAIAIRVVAPPPPPPPPDAGWVADAGAARGGAVADASVTGGGVFASPDAGAGELGDDAAIPFSADAAMPIGADAGFTNTGGPLTATWSCSVEAGGSRSPAPLAWTVLGLALVVWRRRARRRD